MNKVELKGMVGTVKQSDSGIVNFSLLISEASNNGGSIVINQSWFQIRALEKDIRCALEKGKEVYVKGSLRTAQYCDTNNVECTFTYILANIVE